MKKILLIHILIFSFKSSIAQFSDIDLINTFNEKGKIFYGFKTGVIPISINTYYGDLSSNTLMANGTDGMSYALESLIIMYKTTKDKAYLYEFIRQALELQHWRGNYNEVSNSEIKNNSI
jgi:hypothetical protein